MSAVIVTSNDGDGSNSNSNSRITSTQKRGNVASLKDENLTAIDTFGNVFNVPDFSIKDILQAIPKECYKRSAVKSLSFVLRDILAMVTIGSISYNYIELIPWKFARFCCWALNCWLLGLFGTGLWVLAHECGHQAFSDYGWLNDTVGWILHSYLLVPYFSWKFSHGKHHKATGHLTRDMVFVPATKDEFLAARNVSHLAELAEDSPIVALYELLAQQLGGWLMYLTSNVSGQPYSDVPFWKKNHFVPTAPLFDKKDYWFIWLSDLGILLQFLILYKWVNTFGWFNFTVFWFVPYILVNHWLVFITFLQHSDPTMPHYEAEQWTFARGAAATIDRDFGFVGKYIFHDIIETHVLHHYVSRIPFYNGRVGTEAIKKVMGKHYRYSNENMWKSLWKSGRYCQFVEGENGVKMYRNINGLGVAPADLQKK
ncbi:hypothetical protein PACTADRAFT_50000 [Pachysolen tannophilus NRRL Y-2460]|uniref:Fatty acid desaturase domain-containing protein n=1 Tax=Pachysolen tannophilus NRRL Y-2460 TaxID=669874 RepID=A0A1E4TU46_PACTA|nr:hypothetical protein PACTADRAFT_50000 [Pachysolen tannophilus NRRL Y-2460]